MRKNNYFAILGNLLTFIFWIFFSLYIMFILENQPTKNNKFLLELNFDIQEINILFIIFSCTFLILTKIVASSDGYIYSISQKNYLDFYVNKIILNEKLLFAIFSYFIWGVLLREGIFNKFFFLSIVYITYFYLLVKICKRKCGQVIVSNPITLLDCLQIEIKLNILKINRKNIEIVYLILTTILLLIVTIDLLIIENLNSIFLFPFIVTIITFIYYLIKYGTSNFKKIFKMKNILNLKILLRRTKNIVLKTFFMEFYAAEQSKSNEENIAILKKIYEESQINIQFKDSDLWTLILLSERRVFLHRNDNDFVRNLSLKYSNDFSLFLDNIKKWDEKFGLKDSEMTILNDFKERHRLYPEETMTARKHNIVNRNKNNKYIGIFLLIFTFFIYWILDQSMQGIYNYVPKLIVLGVFIRLILRSSEICRAFYLDLKSNKYKSFISGNQRISLAINSLIEIVSLCSIIYISKLIIYEELQDIYFRDFLEATGYSIAVSLFNVSFASTITDLDKRNIIIILTHLIQLISSIILITLSIANYINSPKIPMYYYILIENDFLKIEKKSFDQYIQKNIIKIPKSEYFNEYELGIKNNYDDGKISEEDAYFSLLILKEYQNYDSSILLEPEGKNDKN